MSDSQNINNQSEINKMKAEIMYDEIIIKYNHIKDIDNEENVIKKIIELNFDENQLKEYYEQRIYDEFEEEYGLSAILEVEDIKEKIKELHCNKELIERWIESLPTEQKFFRFNY